MPIRSLRGTSFPSLHDEYKPMICPFTGEELLLVPAIEPDVALIHAQYGDAKGNLVIQGPPVADILFAKASRVVLATVEEIVPTERLSDLGGVSIPYFYVTALSEAPMGAHPTACYPFYAYDRPHTALYYEAARKGADGFQDRLSRRLRSRRAKPRRLSRADRRRGDARAARLLARWCRGMETPLPRRGGAMTKTCTLGEMMIAALARTIEDGALVFHGFGSPLVQLAMHVAKRTHAPRMVLVAGATYGVDPDPPFLTPTTNDWVMDRGASSSLDIEELFDLAAAGRMGRMFLSGLQIDKWGNCNVTALGLSGCHDEAARRRRRRQSVLRRKPCHPLDRPPIGRRRMQKDAAASGWSRLATSSPISAIAVATEGRAENTAIAATAHNGW